MKNEIKYQREDFCCQAIYDFLENELIPVVYIPKYREFGVRILDGGTSFQEIKFCPCCGSPLPESLRNFWFDELENIGCDPFGEYVPEKMQTDFWWKQKREQSEHRIRATFRKASNVAISVT